ncbi:MAG: flagellar basal body-associated FliL family protein [Pseudomonadales bacterium]
MAKDKKDAATAEEDSENKKSKLPLIIGLVVLLLGGGSAGAYFMGVFDSAEVAEEGTAEAEPVKAVAMYANLKPDFILNFKVNGRGHFLKVAISLLTREQDVVDAVEQHMPLLRNELVMLFSAEEFDTLKTAEGKESLRGRALTAIQAIMEKEIGKAGVEQVLFTDFVLQ